jgi:hypothetical protein
MTSRSPLMASCAILAAACASPAPTYVYAYVPVTQEPPAPPQTLGVDHPAALIRLFRAEEAAREVDQASQASHLLTPWRCRAMLAAVPDDARNYLTTQERACQEMAPQEGLRRVSY